MSSAVLSGPEVEAVLKAHVGGIREQLLDLFANEISILQSEIEVNVPGVPYPVEQCASSAQVEATSSAWRFRSVLLFHWNTQIVRVSVSDPQGNIAFKFSAPDVSENGDEHIEIEEFDFDVFIAYKLAFLSK